ncbi:MAG: sensor histidine kinase [Candidatus Thorarchaeota archaeon]
MGDRKGIYWTHQEYTESEQDSLYCNEELAKCSCLDYSSCITLKINQNHCVFSIEELAEIIEPILIDKDSLHKDEEPTQINISKIYFNTNESNLNNTTSNNPEEDRSTVPTIGKSEPSVDFLFRILDSFTYPFYIIDVSDYTIKMANRAAMIEQLDETSTCHSIIHRSPVPCWEKGQDCPLVTIKRTKKPVILEHMHFDENRDLRVIEVHGYPVIDSIGEVVQIIKYGFDVTDQKWVEGQLAKESRRARLFLDLLAHDMANELQVIQGSAELAKEMLLIEDESEMIPRFVHQIVESVNRCMMLIAKARSTENLAVVPLVERSLARALLECVETIGEKFTNCVFIIEYEDSEAAVMADKYLENLLTNVLSNAVKHNPSTQKSVWVRLCPSNDGYDISISDNGPGIEDVMKEILFDPKHRFGGLGIHFSLQIVEKYGGKITVRDRVHGKPNEGVEFVIWLPKIRSS